MFLVVTAVVVDRSVAAVVAIDKSAGAVFGTPAVDLGFHRPVAFGDELGVQRLLWVLMLVLVLEIAALTLYELVVLGDGSRLGAVWSDLVVDAVSV
jgi:hypothetical protein